jgi:hypothetical protein
MKYIFLLGMLMSYVQLSACDLCGGVGSNASIGIFASNRFHLVGWRQTYRMFDSYLYGIKHSSEAIWQSDLNFRTQLGKRIQVYGAIPFQVARQKTDFTTVFVSGFSDPNVLFTYALIDKKDSMNVTHDFLNIGLGAKFPFGKFLSYQNALKNLAPGTGTIDGLILGNYTHRFQEGWSFQGEASHALKGIDREGYQFGNSSQLSSSMIYNRKIQGYRLISSLGLQFDDFQASRLNGVQLVAQSNRGYILAMKASINLLTNRFLFSAQVQAPIKQELNQGSIQQKIVFGLSLNYLIQKKQHEKNNA